jgi:hypothetical protein
LLLLYLLLPAVNLLWFAKWQQFDWWWSLWMMKQLLKRVTALMGPWI